MYDTKEKQIDIREILQVVTKRKWLLIIPLIIVISISYGGSYMMAPKYESQVTILNSPSQLVSGQMARLIPGDYGNVRLSDRQISRKMNEVRGHITSGLNLSMVVTQLNLDENTEMMKTATDLQENYPNISTQELVYRAMVDDLRNRISISFISENMIRVSVQHGDPILARDIAQTLAEVYRDEKLKSELLAVRSKLDFSNTQAQIYKKDLEEKEDALAEFKRDYQKSAIDRGLTTNENLKDIESELDRTRLTDKIEANDRLNFLESKLVAVGIDPADLGMPVELNVSKRLLMERTTAWANLMEKYTWRDSKMTTKRRQVENTLDTIRTMVESNVTNQYAGMSDENIEMISEYVFTKIELDYHLHKEKRLTKSKEDIKNSFSTSPDSDIQLATLEKDVERAKAWYDNFLTSYTGSQLAMEVYREEAESRYQILEPAFIPLAPFWPNRIKITLMGVALGLLIGVGAMILAEVTDNSIKKIESIESNFNLKVLGTIPKIDFRKAPERKVPVEKNMVGSKV